MLEISKLFSSRTLTKEIRSYLLEIISNDQKTNKQLLSERLEVFFPFLLDKQFIPKNVNAYNQNLLSSFANFYGYWFILSNLNTDKNFIPDNLKQKFITFLKLLDSNTSDINLSHQDLSGHILDGLNLSNSILNYTNFHSCSMMGIILDNSLLHNTNFSFAQMDGASLNRASIQSALFDDSS